VSTARFLGIICLAVSLFATTLYAQFSAAPEFSVNGELRSHSDTGSNDFMVEVYDLRTNTVIEREPVNHGQFTLDHVPVGSYSVRLVTAAGETPIVEQFHQFEPGGSPLVLELPERPTSRPASGFVSLHDLEHPVPKKAREAAYQAQVLSLANHTPKAIAKLEDAIRIDPDFRDAHLNLGVQYARVGRTADAHAEFEKALEIGPPAAPIYADLAISSLALHRYRDAEAFSRKALELDPSNTGAQKTLEYSLQH
jgi:tetratricopeptide (TPR) repeat protein